MHSLIWWPTLLVLMVATATDLRSRRIPNWLVAPFFVSGVLVLTAIGGIHGLSESLLGALLAASVTGTLYALGGMGMGDVKLFIAIGAWIGPGQTTMALVSTGIAGGVMALFWALRGGFLSEAIGGAGDLVAGLGRRGLQRHDTLVLSNPRAHKMPYAPAIALGTIFSFLAKS